jgi:long-subunit acyl-CoA synthetase (AMP-forming)
MSALLESVTEAYAYMHYVSTLCPSGEDASKKFVHYYSFPESVEKVITEISYSRKEYSILVQKAITMCLEKHLYGGKRILMHITGNHLEDLILRSAATVLGFVPVTVNWQADSLEQVKYKLTATNSSAVIYDDHSIGIVELQAAFPDVAFIHHNELYSYASIENFYEWILSCPYLPKQTDIRCIIFTSGTTGNPKGNTDCVKTLS